MLQTVALHLQRLFRPPDRLKFASQRTLLAKHEEIAMIDDQWGDAGRLNDVAKLREHARQDVACGAVTHGYGRIAARIVQLDVMEEILAKEEEHAEDRASLLQGVSSAARGARF